MLVFPIRIVKTSPIKTIATREYVVFRSAVPSLQNPRSLFTFGPFLEFRGSGLRDFISLRAASSIPILLPAIPVPKP